MVGPSALSADAALAALRACRLFAGLDDESLGLVAAALRPRRFRRAETVFHAGDPGDALFIVESGQVKITLPPDDGSEPAILTTIGPGGFFGELALLDGAPRSATAVAIDAVTTMVLRRDAFDRLVDEAPPLRHALLATLAGGDPAPDRARSRTCTSSTFPGGWPATSCARSPASRGCPTTIPRRCPPGRSGCRGRSPRPSWPG